MTDRTSLYRTVWRWHFYASLLVMPLVLVLATTGAIYLFKPDIDRWEERNFRGIDAAHAVAPEDQVRSALQRNPGWRFLALRVPAAPGDAALIRLGAASGGATRDIFVAPNGAVLAAFDTEDRISAVVARVHGTLLAGKAGSVLVELAASWAIVMILSGLYLWWPRRRGLLAVLWPRLHLRGRAFWRDLHAVVGIWVSGFALVMLLTGLPWTDVWGPAFKALRAELGWVVSEPGNWRVGHDTHAGHDGHGAMMMTQGVPVGGGLHQMSAVVRLAAQQRLPDPVYVSPPGAPQRFGPPNGSFWRISSESQNRPLNRSIEVDPESLRIIRQSGFADLHAIDKVVNVGIAWHEGQLFGRVNQAVGVLTALALITLTVSGFVMWRRRWPGPGLGSPPVALVAVRAPVAVAILLAFALVLPLLGASLALVLAFDKFVLPRLPRLAGWLGALPEARPS